MDSMLCCSDIPIILLLCRKVRNSKKFQSVLDEQSYLAKTGRSRVNINIPKKRLQILMLGMDFMLYCSGILMFSLSSAIL